MSENIERAKSRLENISAIEPLLSALRTISMGTWQMALNKIKQLRAYEGYYDQIIAEIAPQIKQTKIKGASLTNKPTELADTIVLLIGTERGLCGKFNESLIEQSLRWLDKFSEADIQIWAMGSRLIRKLNQMNVDFTWRQPLPTSELLSYKQAYLTTQKWIKQFEEHDFNKFIILSNQLEAGSLYHFSTYQLLPFTLKPIQKTQVNSEQRWPPPIIETDPKGILRQITQQNIAANYYQIVLKSSAAEHAARFNLMQEAKDNADDIIEELQRIINTERKRKITQQMQELAIGAGLLEKQ